MNEQEKERASLTGEGCPPPSPDLNTKSPGNVSESQPVAESGERESAGSDENSGDSAAAPVTTPAPPSAEPGEVGEDPGNPAESEMPQASENASTPPPVE